MNNTFLNDNQIDLMADAAVTSYEFTADWSEALRVAIEYSIDEFGIKPRKSAALLAVKIAKTKWMAISYAVKREVV